MSLRPKDYESARAAYKPMRRSPISRSKPLKRISEPQKPSEEQNASHSLSQRKRSTFKQRSKGLKRHRPSKEEIKWREEVLKGAGYRCQWVDPRTEFRCNERGAENLDAHHIAKRTQRPDLKLDIPNGAALCRFHHSYSDTVQGAKEARAQGLLGGETYEKAMKK